MPEPRRFTVSKGQLASIAATLWLGVGALLVARGWAMLPAGAPVLAATLAGAAGGTVLALFGFSRVAARNVERIDALPERASPWAVMAPASYVLVAFMMTLGLVLRRVPMVPRLPLGVLYLGIGSALGLSSGVYLLAARRFRRRSAAGELPSLDEAARG